MRVLKLELAGLNSLADPVSLDFENNTALKNSGLFAILGPTGAGKSTLLDAITLALYGRTPRLNRGDAIKAILTKGKAEAYSSLIFAVNEDRYKADWLIHTARKSFDGAIQAPKCSLSQWIEDDWKILSESLSDKTRRVEELLGMKYEEFSRSILLAQGSFAGFLASPAKERAQLLEKITGTQIYAQISTQIFELFKESRQAYETKKQAIEDMNLLTREQLEEIQGQLQKLAKEEEEIQVKIKANESKIAKLDNFKKHSEAKQEALQKLEELKIDVEKSSPIREELKCSQELAGLREPLSKLNQNIENLSQSKEGLGGLQEQKEALNQKAKDIEEKLQSLQEKHKEEKQSLDESLSTLQKAYIPLKEREKNLYEELEKSRVALDVTQKQLYVLRLKHQGKQELFDSESKKFEELKSYLKDRENYSKLSTEQLESNSREFFDLTEAVTGIKVQLTKESQAIGDLEAKVKSFEDSLKPKQEEIETKKRKCDQVSASLGQELFLGGKPVESSLYFWTNALGHLNELISKKSSIDTLNKDYEKLNSELPKLKESKESLEQQLENLTKEQTQLHSQLESLEKQQNQKDIRESLDQLRSELIEGEACPLCGSSEHDLDSFHGQESDLNSETADLKLKLEAVTTKLKNVEKESLESGWKFKESKQKLNNLTLELESANKALEELIKDFGFTISLELETEQMNELKSKLVNLTKSLASIQMDQEELDKIVRDQAELKSLLESKKSDLGKLENQKETNQKLLDRVTDQLGNDLVVLGLGEQEINSNLLDRAKTALQEYESKTSGSMKLEESARQLEKELQASKAELDSLRKDQKAHQNKSTELEGKLSQVREDLREIHAGDFEHHCQELQSKFEKLVQELQELEQSKIKTLQEEKSLTEQISKIETQIKDLEVLSARQESELKSKLPEYVQDIADLKNYLLPYDREQALQKQIQEQDQQVLKLQTILEEKDKLCKELENDLPKEPREELLENQIALQEEIKPIQTQTLDLQFKVKENETRKDELKSLHKELDLVQTDFSYWNKINSALGSADGSKFSNVVQAMVLKELVWHANQQLKKLAPRYLLVQNSSEALDLDVIDSFQANTIRSVRTLSGGETFLISLALALSLSKMASKKTPIHSLFLDEGFGTLDEDTLAVALSALDNLQAEGKTIGVISHVRELKETIPTQIQVVPQGGGVSLVRVVG